MVFLIHLLFVFILILLVSFLVPSQVFNLTATNTSSTSIAATWLAPLHPNGVIRQYRISVKKEKKENNTQQINFYCIDCQRPCPKPDFSNKVQYICLILHFRRLIDY